jgi:outer membrane receptor protein involved in Fe transport
VKVTHNVLGTTPRFGLYDNSAVVQDDFNEGNISGGRITARFFPNDDWTVTTGVVYQKTESDGRPEMDQTLGDLKVVRFRPDKEYDNQDWTQYALTIEGDVGFAEFVSATSYFTRDWEYTQDTTSYASYFGTFCYGGSYDAAGYWQPYVGGYSKYCFQPAGVGNYYNDPIGYLKNTQKNTKFAQEFRLSAQGEKLDWVAGVFYEKSTEDWDFTTITDGYSQSQAIDNYAAGRLLWSGYPIPSVYNNDDVWWNSFDRSDFEQKAIFGEATFHVNDKVDVTVGGRYFERTMEKTYWVEQPSGNIGSDGILHPSSDDTDFVPKFTVKYAVNDDVMVYGLYSEGFRPGGTNRGRGLPFHPPAFAADSLDNVEFGVKSVLADGRVRLNATFFDMSWNDYQLEVVDPSNIKCDADNALPEPNCGQPWQKVVANVGNASSQGLEIQMDAAFNENLTWGVNATWLDAVLDQDVEFSPGNFVPKGTRLPLSPEFKASAYATYEWPVDWFGGSNAYVRLQWSHVGDMFNQVEPLGLPAPQFVQPSYEISDLKFGITGEDWTVQLFVNNLTDERAVLFDNPYDFDYFFGHGKQTVNRPREIGIRYSKSFSD